MFRALIAVAVVTIAAPAWASSRQFVASYGNDANPCTLVQPCRSFTTAVAMVADRGEVIVLDSAGYGVVTINKSVAITAPPGVYAGITPSGGQNGVQLVPFANDVRLEGLTMVGGLTGINNGGFSSTLKIVRCRVIGAGMYGIASYPAGSSVQIVDTEVSGAGTAGLYMEFAHVTINSSLITGNGMGVVLANNARVSLKDVVVSSNVWGIRVYAPPGTYTTATIDHSDISNNYNYGMQAECEGSTSVVGVSVSRSIVSNNGWGVAALTIDPGCTAHVTASEDAVSDNRTEGIKASGAGAVAYANGNTVTRNGASGLLGESGGIVYSSQDNAVTVNNPDLGGGVAPFTKS